METDIGIGTARQADTEPLADAYRWPTGTGRGESMTINHPLLRLAQQKARDARQNGDGAKWMEANEEMKRAAGMPWYRGNSNQRGGEHARG